MVAALAGVVVLMALSILLPMPDESRSAADTVYRMLASVAIIVGGSFAYFQFVAGRTLQRRLELTVSGDLDRAAGFVYLSVDATVQNIGNSRVTIEGERNLLMVSGHSSHERDPVVQAKQATWRAISGWPLAAEVGSLEPKETVRESLLLQIPEVSPEQPYKAFKLTLYIFAKGGQTWEVTEIVKIRSTGDNQG